MFEDLELVITRLLIALAAGALIGLERTFHGRPAGFRTHCLVCASSSLLMLIVTFQSKFMPADALESVRVDPTRMAQGVMTGIGFLGGGVIVKEGITVRGLTTAASIWITAAIGITVGVGFYWAAGVATVATFGILGVFRWLEVVIPTQLYAQLTVDFHADDVLPESELCALLKRHRMSGSSTAYRLDLNEKDERMVRYEMTIKTRRGGELSRLADSLRSESSIHEYSITRSGL